jgi:hypothetical protein
VRFFPFALPIFTATTARETTTNPSRKPHNSFRNRAETPQKNTNINFRRRSGSITSISKDRLILPEDMFPESFSTRAIRRKQQRKTNNPSPRSKTPFRTPFSTISTNFFQDFATAWCPFPSGKEDDDERTKNPRKNREQKGKRGEEGAREAHETRVVRCCSSLWVPASPLEISLGISVLGSHLETFISGPSFFFFAVLVLVTSIPTGDSWLNPSQPPTTWPATLLFTGRGKSPTSLLFSVFRGGGSEDFRQIANFFFKLEKA